MQYTPDLPPLQDVLIDIHPKTSKVIQWAQKHIQNEKMAESHIRISQNDPEFVNRASKLLNCGSLLTFKRMIETNERKLFQAFFCKYVLCPTCMWRRSLKIYGQTSLILDESERQGFKHIFGSFTVKNCKVDEIPQTLKHLQTSFKRLFNTNRFKGSVHGWIRVIEITHNIKRTSKDFDTFHIHIHSIFQVRTSYFRDEKYIKKEEWTDMWIDAARLDYFPQVDIRKVYKKNDVHMREISKYISKPSDILNDDRELTDRTVKALDHALFQKRMVSLGGGLKDIKRDLNLDDAETGDLIIVDGQKINPELGFILEKYGWHAGYRQYMRKS